MRSWLTKRQAGCSTARHVLRILGMLEVRYHFKTIAFYIRTYHNLTADWLSRETRKVVIEHMELQGWSCVDAMEKWEHYIRESIQGIYRWPGGEAVYDPGSDAKELAGHHYSPMIGKGLGVELGAGRLPWAIAWERIGGTVRRVQSKGSKADVALERATLGELAELGTTEELTWAFASIAEDSWGGSQAYLKKFVRDNRPQNILIDVAPNGPRKAIRSSLAEFGYEVEELDCITSHFGDPVAKHKAILVGWKHPWEKSTPPSQAPRSHGEPPAFNGHWTPTHTGGQA